MKITAWNIGIVWEDGTEEKIADIPDWVANRVDEFLNELEEEYESVNKTSPVRSKAELEGLLTKALAEENYEEAAKLRDEIEKL
mgnify:CR=1 FL=1